MFLRGKGYAMEVFLMKLFDRLKNSLKSPEKITPLPASEMPGEGQETAESLWNSLCDNPNQEDKIPALISICEKKGGPSAVYAALNELCGIKGSWLPETYLGRMALEQKDFNQAREWYQRVLTADNPDNYALFMISADLGRFGFAARMPELIEPAYDVSRHDVYIGLNLLQAYREMQDPQSGSELLRRIQKHDRPDIHDYLEGFAADFAQMSGEIPPAAELREAEPVPPLEQVIEEAEQDVTLTRLPRAAQIDIPVWIRDVPGLLDMMPSAAARKRVGVYMYADTSAQGTPGYLKDDTVRPSDLAVSLPLFIGERLLFTTHFAPIALFPISREKGPQAENLEPDVQSLFALCTKEALDFIITGTVFRDGNVYRVRSWILDKAKQSARIVAKDLPAQNFGEPFNNMINDIMLLFFDKRYVKPSGRTDFPYEIPTPELVPAQLQATSYLLYQSLVQQKICDTAILPDEKKMLDTYAFLSGTDPKNQMYLMMLLSGMKNVLLAGSNLYQYYRHVLFEVADKNRYSNCVKASLREINFLLQDQ